MAKMSYRHPLNTPRKPSAWRRDRVKVMSLALNVALVIFGIMHLRGVL